MTTDCLNFLSDMTFRIGVAIFIIYQLFKNKSLMNKIEELEAAIADQTNKIEAEKVQVRAILADQTASIAALEEQVANGGSAEKLQELITKVKENTVALTKIYAAPGEEEAEKEA